jgi:D-alanyl-D-alanine carboxypeptidase (penicillin-binding protein 5/6)
MKTYPLLLTALLISIFTCHTVLASRAPLKSVAAEPYAAAIVMDARTGEVFFAKNADAKVYPASTLKLMVLLVILDKIAAGNLQLNDMVQISVEAAKMGGSQVYLDSKEQFSIEDLLYALMIQSANDAAVALATHVAGSKELFVTLMNQKAAELGMTSTRFNSVHGLPPAKGQKVDITTARDFAILCQALSKRPEVFKYTGTKVRDFRDGKFIMRTHNHLLENVEGCDGFKTGYFVKAGFSIAATAKRGDTRIIAIVMGSKNRKVRDAKATELLALGFVKASSKPAQERILPLPPQVKTMETGVEGVELIEQAVPQSASKEVASPVRPGWGRFFIGLGLGFLLYAALDHLLLGRRNRSSRRRRRL